MTGEKPCWVTSTGSVRYVLGSTFAGPAELERSQSWTELEVTVLVSTRADGGAPAGESETDARIIPVVEKPSSVWNAGAVALGLPFESMQAPVVALYVPCESAHAPWAEIWPGASRSRSNGSGTNPRFGSTCTCVFKGAMAKVVIAASSSWGKTWLIAGKAANL